MSRFNLFLSLAATVALVSVGCDPKAGSKPVADLKKAPAGDHDHEHGAKGPHGGGLIELGAEEYHAELVVDHDVHSIVVYVLGKDAKTPELVTATEVTVTPEGKDAVTLKAAPQQGEADGKTSKFAAENDDLVHAWMEAKFVHGDLRITIGDKNYVGHIDYHMDGDHDHDHDEKKPAEGAAK